VSVTASPPSDPAGGAQAPATAPVSAGESCPLCGGPLQPAQEWCLRCGAAARTRLAAAPNWKGPTATLAVLAALCLGVIAAALVKLAGETGPAPAAITRTITTAPAAGALPPASTVPTAPTTAGGVAPGLTTTTPVPGAASAPTSSTARTTPGTTAPATTNTSRTTRPLSPAARKRAEELNLAGRVNTK
jgi:hypothetical protein